MRIMLFVLVAGLVGCTVPPSPIATNAPIAEIAGRVAGAPRRCVLVERNEALRVASPNTVIYGSGRTVWLNSVPQCSTLRQSDILVLEPVGSQYCKGDFVRTQDNVSGIPGPGCRLGDFVPYSRP